MTFSLLALYLSCPKVIIPVERFYVTKIRSLILIESMTSFSFHEECQLERNHQGYWNLLRIVWCPLTITYVHLLKVIQNTAFFEIQHVTYTLTHARRKKSQRLEMSRHHKSCYMLQCQRHRQRRMKKKMPYLQYYAMLYQLKAMIAHPIIIEEQRNIYPTYQFQEIILYKKTGRYTYLKILNLYKAR